MKCYFVELIINKDHVCDKIIITAKQLHLVMAAQNRIS
jgi:hypothetical protein